MRITTGKLYFIISEEEVGPRRPLVWCELPVSFYFQEYNMVGVNEDYNEIYLVVPTSNRNKPVKYQLFLIFILVLLARSLATLKQDMKLFKIKLTNKDTPCITIEMELVR